MQTKDLILRYMWRHTEDEKDVIIGALLALLRIECQVSDNKILEYASDAVQEWHKLCGREVLV